MYMATLSLLAGNGVIEYVEVFVVVRLCCAGRGHYYSSG